MASPILAAASMDALDMLRFEHEQILKALSWVPTLTARPNPTPLGELARFIGEFADGLHHAKEEKLLFTALELAGLPRGQGPIGCMLAEHDAGRVYTRMMADGAAQALADRAGALEGAVGAAKAYAELLTAHIRKENEVLFVMARRMLTPDELSVLTDAFRELDQKHGSMERAFFALEQRLSDAYGS